MSFFLNPKLLQGQGVRNKEVQTAVHQALPVCAPVGPAGGEGQSKPDKMQRLFPHAVVDLRQRTKEICRLNSSPQPGTFSTCHSSLRQAKLPLM